MKKLFLEWRNWRRFKALPPAERQIVIYSEDAGSWPHFEPIVRELTEVQGRRLCFVSSSHDDPLLKRKHERIQTFAIGFGLIRTSFFMDLQAGVLLMTMPDLQTYHIKRSKSWPVHYAHVFHSIVSSHMTYRNGAFDAFDTLLCVGPHHIAETRAREQRLGLPAKSLVEHGYGRLDAILARNAGRVRPSRAPDQPLRVLLAPSWGPQGLIEQHGPEVIEILLNAGFDLMVRPHPMTPRKWPEKIETLRRRFAGRRGFALETDVASQESLHASDLMISDWSGAALEYAFGLERPVLFVDMPRKVNNPHYEEIGCLPLEVGIRAQLGQVVAPGNLAAIPAAVRQLCADPEAYRERLRRLRAATVFNVGRSGAVGAQTIAALVDRPSRQAAAR